MIKHLHKKKVLVQLELGVLAVLVVWVFKSNTGQEIVKRQAHNSNKMAAFPETNRRQASKRFNEQTIKLPNYTSYWGRKVFNFYNLPDKFSHLIGPDNVTFPHKYIIYRCDNDTMRHCGGWADRVKSIITAYLIANLTGRVFKAENIMADCHLQRFVVPNQVNWSLPVSFHQTVNLSQQVAQIDMFSQTHFYQEFSEIDWVHHPTMTADFVYIKSNHDNADNFIKHRLHPQSLQWMQKLNRVSVNRVLFKRLFRPSDYLQNKLIDFLTQNVKADDKLICAHLRMGQNPTIPDDFRDSIDIKHLARVWRLIRTLSLRYRTNVKIFLMSDSETAIAKAQNDVLKDKLFVSPGKIVHVELSKSASAKEKCEGLEKVIFEQQILPHCDSLIITDSGISRMAAYLRGRDDHLYCLLRQGHLIPCRPMDLKTKFYHTIN